MKRYRDTIHDGNKNHRTIHNECLKAVWKLSNLPDTVVQDFGFSTGMAEARGTVSSSPAWSIA